MTTILITIGAVYGVCGLIGFPILEREYRAARRDLRP